MNVLITIENMSDFVKFAEEFRSKEKFYSFLKLNIV